MVVDFHIHPAWWPEMTPEFLHFLHRLWTPAEYDALREECRTGAGLAGHLRSRGLDYAVVLAEVNAMTGRMDNDTVLALCRDQEMLIPFGTVNPQMHHDLRRLLVELADRGIRGIKLYPTYDFFHPNDRIFYPFYAKAEELGIPIMVHTGSSVFPGARINFGNPLLLDDVAVDFPGLTIVVSHAGRPFWYAQAEYLARFHENVYLDVSGLPPQNLVKYLPSAERLRSKLIFGTDWPGERTIAENIAAVQRLPLSQEAIDAMLYDNAARVLGLPPRRAG